jgi:hypothetical protein
MGAEGLQGVVDHYQWLHIYHNKLPKGDKVGVLVYPTEQHDCDDALILEAHIWEQRAHNG